MRQIKVRKSYIESHCRSLTQLLILNETSVRPSEGRLIILVLVYLGIGASQGKNSNKRHRYTEMDPFLENWAKSGKCSKSWASIHRKSSIQSAKLHISHHMKPY